MDTRPYLSACITSAILAIGTVSQAADFSSLKPPAGASVAVVIFADLQCPQCPQANRLVWSAARAHHVPVIWHDTIAPRDQWAFRAAIDARFFAARSLKLGDDFRGYILANQPNVSLANLNLYAQKFADENKVPLPFAVDPHGKLQEQVDSDWDLSRRVGITRIPTIVVVGRKIAREVANIAALSSVIEQMQK